MRTRFIAILAVCVTLCSVAYADSLWQPDKKASYTDTKAQKVGDLVTVIIVENSSASQKTQTTVSKTSKVASDQGTGFLLNNLPKMGAGGSSSSNATGSTTRSSNLVAEITTTIAEIKPNGDFVLNGSREVKANDENQTLKITGTVRPQDISTDNTVQSSYLSDAKIEYVGHGAVSDNQKPGILTRLFKLLF